MKSVSPKTADDDCDIFFLLGICHVYASISDVFFGGSKWETLETTSGFLVFLMIPLGRQAG